MRSNILSKLIFASCAWYSDRAYYGLCGLIKDIGRRLPLELQCSYQGQQGDVGQSVRGNYKTRFWGGQHLTAAEENASVYQVNPVSRITGEGRAEFWRAWGPGLDQTQAPTSLKTPPSPHRLFDLQDSLDKRMHFLPQLSDFVSLKNGFYSFCAQTD